MRNLRKLLKIMGIVLLFLLGVLFVAGGLFGLGILSRKPLKAVPSTTHPSIGRQECIHCHAPIAEEWRESFHYRSVSGPYWKQVDQMGYTNMFHKLRKACINCHAPANVLDLPKNTGPSSDQQLGVECTPNILKEPKGIIPSARLDDVALGVDCVSCHVSKQGIIGSGQHPNPNHESIPDPRFQNANATSDTVCRICHSTAVNAWKQTKFAAQGVTCLDCHMPLVRAASVSNGPARTRRSHRFLADKDVGMLRKAVQASLDIAQNKDATLRIRNSGTGHFLPSGGNWLIVYLKGYDVIGKVVQEQREVFGKEETLLLDFWPFNQDSRIRSGEEKEIKLSLKEEHGLLEAVVRYWDWIHHVKTIVTLKKHY